MTLTFRSLFVAAVVFLALGMTPESADAQYYPRYNPDTGLVERIIPRVPRPDGGYPRWHPSQIHRYEDTNRSYNRNTRSERRYRSRNERRYRGYHN